MPSDVPDLAWEFTFQIHHMMVLGGLTFTRADSMMTGVRQIRSSDGQIALHKEFIGKSKKGPRWTQSVSALNSKAVQVR